MQTYHVGVDVGSTTVKMIILDEEDPAGASDYNAQQFLEI